MSSGDSIIATFDFECCYRCNKSDPLDLSCLDVEVDVQDFEIRCLNYDSSFEPEEE